MTARSRPEYYVIYVPGLGDSAKAAQCVLMSTLGRYGLEVETFDVRWTGTETYDAKLRRLVDRIWQLGDGGGNVSVLAFSGGATLATEAYVEAPNRINSLVFISGKLGGGVNPLYFRRNPAFQQAWEGLPAALDKLGAQDIPKLLTFGSRHDVVVPLRHATLPDARRRVVFGLGHAGTLITSVLLHGREIADFIKR